MRKRIFRIFHIVKKGLMNRISSFNIPIFSRLMDEIGRKAGVIGEVRRRVGDYECGASGNGFIYVKNSSSAKKMDELVRYLRAISDGETGLNVIEHVYRRDEIYRGPFLKDAPELILLPETGYEFKVNTPRDLVKIRPVKGMTCRTGTHASSKALNGFFAMIGDGIREGVRFNACVYDIAPTVLHILGLFIPTNVDGYVMARAFEEGSSLARRPVRKERVSLREKLAMKARGLRAFMKLHKGV